MQFPKYLIFAAVFAFFSAAFAVAGPMAEAKPSFYVSANGSNENNGFSEQTAFRTLSKAVERASSGAIKRITVIGALNSESEFLDTETNEDEESVFNIVNSGSTEILITGKPGENAALQGGDDRRVISILGNSRIRFENILITGGNTWEEGGGIYADEGADITLAQGTVISGNSSSEGGGIFAYDSSLTMMGNAVIRDNMVFTDEGGGAVVVGGSFTMKDDSQITRNSGGGLILEHGDGRLLDNASITDNECEYYGGGVMIYSSAFTMSGNSSISGNMAGAGGGGISAHEGILTFFDNAIVAENKTEGKGGGIYSTSGSVTVRGHALISDNVSADDGGGIYCKNGYIVLDEYAKLLGNESMCGGGFCIEEGSSAIVRGSVQVSGNSAFGPQGGGGICAGYDSNIHMTGGEVINNASSRGGGVYIESGSFVFDGGYITGNKAESGGGIYEIYGDLVINAESAIRDNSPSNILRAKRSGKK